MQASFELVYQPSQYHVDVVEPFYDQEAIMDGDQISDEARSWRVRIDILDNNPRLASEKQKVWKDGDRAPEDYPLSQLYQTFTRLVFEIPRPVQGQVKNFSHPRLLALLHGDPNYTPSVDIPRFIEAEVNAIVTERDYAQSRLNMLEGIGLHLETELYRGNNILLNITPPNDVSGFDWDSVLGAGAKLELVSPTFTRHAAQYSAYCERDIWIAQIIHGLDKAPITAVLLHTVPPEQLELFSNVREDHCKLLPLQIDVSSKRGLFATERTEAATNQAELDMLITKLNSSHVTKSRIPLRQMLMVHEQPDDIDRESELPNGMVMPSFAGSAANTSQQQAIRNAFCHKVSLIQGPPGSGKTRTISYLCEFLLADAGRWNILICAPTNVAADEITRKLLSHPGTSNSRVTRVLSHQAGEAKIHSQETSDIDRAYLHNISHRHARQLTMQGSRDYLNYLDGIAEICENGYIMNGAVLDHYERERDMITNEVIKQARVVVCTCSASALPLLNQFDPLALIIDEAAYAKHFEILLPIVMGDKGLLQRVVLVGDHQQFAGFFVTPTGRAQWHKSLFEKLIQHDHQGIKWPSVMLKNVYRAHSGLCSHTSSIFYNNELIPSRRVDQYDRFTQELLQGLPLFLKGTCGQTIQLSSYAHFINIANSSPEKKENGSSWNDPECSAVISVFRALVASGRCKPRDILLLAGYTAAVKRLHAGIAALNTPDPPTILTTNAAQGREAEVVILMLTRAHDNLQRSAMTGARLVNVGTSRAKNLFIVVGHWSSVLGLQDCALRKVLLHMQNNNPKFVLPAVRSPLDVLTVHGDIVW